MSNLLGEETKENEIEPQIIQEIVSIPRVDAISDEIWKSLSYRSRVIKVDREGFDKKLTSPNVNSIKMKTLRYKGSFRQLKIDQVIIEDDEEHVDIRNSIDRKQSLAHKLKQTKESEKSSKNLLGIENNAT